MAEQRGARLSVETKRRILAIRKEERSLGKIRSVLCLRYGVKVSRHAGDLHVPEEVGSRSDTCEENKSARDRPDETEGNSQRPYSDVANGKR